MRMNLLTRSWHLAWMLCETIQCSMVEEYCVYERFSLVNVCGKTVFGKIINVTKCVYVFRDDFHKFIHVNHLIHLNN